MWRPFQIDPFFFLSWLYRAFFFLEMVSFHLQFSTGDVQWPMYCSVLPTTSCGAGRFWGGTHWFHWAWFHGLDLVLKTSDMIRCGLKWYELMNCHRKILNITKDVQVFQFVVFMWLNGCIGFAFFCGLQASGSAFAADFARAREELEERRLCERIMKNGHVGSHVWRFWKHLYLTRVLDRCDWYHGHKYMSVPWFPRVLKVQYTIVHPKCFQIPYPVRCTSAGAAAL